MTLSRLLRITRHRLRSLLRQQLVDHDAARELAFHAEQLAREYVAEGMPPEDARAAARRTLGNVPLLEEQCRDQRRVTWLHDLHQDLIQGLRLLRKERAFAAVAVASLAIGIGANAAVLAVIERVLFEPLPMPDAGRLVMIRPVPLDDPRQTPHASLQDYAAWRDRSRAFASIGAAIRDRRDLHGDGDRVLAERLDGQIATPSLFATLGATPQLGRLFTEEDARRDGAAPAIVISHRLWQRRFGGDPLILQRTVGMNGRTTAILGVMPEAFRFPDDRVEFWAPMHVGSERPQSGARFFVVLARLAPGVPIAQADGELTGIAAQLAREWPDRHAGWGVRVQPLREALFGWTARPLLTFQAAVALVLLISCVNLAGLLCARGRVRAPELALRGALGAGRGRLVRQLLAESLLLAIVGGLVGLLVTWWGVRALTTMLPPPGSPGMAPVTVNGRVLGLVMLLSIATGLAFGVAPAIAGVRRTGTPLVPRAARNGGTNGGPPLWGALVSAQIALALVLLIGAGLFLQSVLRLAVRDLHLDPHGLLTFEYRIPGVEHTRRIDTSEGGVLFEIGEPPPSVTLARIHGRLRTLPGVESAAGISFPHLDSLIVPTMTLRAEPTSRPASRSEAESEAGSKTATAPPARTAPTTSGTPLSAAHFLVTPGLFATLRTPFVRGRDFAATDARGAPWVAIVNEAAARRFWPDEDPIGRRVRLEIVPDEQPREVIGVVRDIPVRRTGTEPEPVIYTSYLQQPTRYREPWRNMFGQMTFLVRATGEAAADPLRLVPSARRAVAEIDPLRPIANVALVERQLAVGLWTRRSSALVLGLFAGTAALLAAIGIHGTMAYAVAQRTHEIGVRRALGASAREIVTLIGGRALALIATGLALGLIAARAMTHLIASQLWGIAPTDPGTFAGVSLLLAIVALAAASVPVLRALRVDPTDALKCE